MLVPQLFTCAINNTYNIHLTSIFCSINYWLLSLLEEKISAFTCTLACFPPSTFHSCQSSFIFKLTSLKTFAVLEPQLILPCFVVGCFSKLKAGSGHLSYYDYENIPHCKTKWCARFPFVSYMVLVLWLLFHLKMIVQMGSFPYSMHHSTL